MRLIVSASLLMHPLLPVESLCFPRAAGRYLSTAALAAGCAVTSLDPCWAVTRDFEFSNGHVRIEEPLIVQTKEKSLRLKNPVLIGYGGGGAVFAFSDDDHKNPQLDGVSMTPLIKISWANSADSVRKECQILQYLESKGVMHTEQCWTSLPYPHDGDDRVMIVVAPFVPNAVASVAELASTSLQRTAVEQISQFLVQMLAQHVITIDVQPLISPETGQVTFIDLTEAKILSSSDDDTFTDQTLVASFCAEMVALIPEEWATVAAETVRNEIQRLTSSTSQGLSPLAKEILYSQTFLFPDDEQVASTLLLTSSY